jgi:hypothetical protein
MSLNGLAVGADGTARFFKLPVDANLTPVAESAVSGCVEISYNGRHYRVFKRDLIAHSHWAGARD